MGVYIKDMEMPKACYKCRMYEADIYYCAAAERDIDIPSSDEGRCSFCPLVPVPPHGRLIDADALKETLDYYIREAGWGDTVNKALGWVKDEFIDSEPTIIPADKEEET